MIEPWEKIKEAPERVGFRKLLRRVFVLPDGREEEFVVKDERDCVCALVLTKDMNVILAKQFRTGPEKVLLELPGGICEEGEELERAMRRELLEETGYAGYLTYLGPQYNCGYSTRVTHSFLVQDACKVSDPTPDKNEFIEIVEFSLEDLKRHLRSGQLTDAKTGFLALDYLDLL